MKLVPTAEREKKKNHGLSMPYLEAIPNKTRR